jgi:signal transduction histidine kinase
MDAICSFEEDEDRNPAVPLGAERMAILGSMLEAVVIHDGRVVRWANAAAERLWGAPDAGRVVGRPLATLFRAAAAPVDLPGGGVAISLRLPPPSNAAIDAFDLPVRLEGELLHACLVSERGARVVGPALLDRLNRIERLGWLAAGATHDLNNVLVCAMADLAGAAARLGDLLQALRHAPWPEAQDLVRAVRESAQAVAATQLALESSAAHSRELQRLYREERGGGARAPVNLRQAAERTIRLARPQVRVHVELSGDADLHASAPEGSVVRVVMNLLLNAAEAFAPDAVAPRIEVKVSRQGDRAVCDVIDNGPGVAPAALPWLFEPFATFRRDGRGVGLGLSVSRALARDAGGDLQLHATSPRGATFRLSLPLAEPPAPKATAAQSVG